MLLICTHPRSCQPVGLPPVLQSLHANPRRRKLQLGDPSSSGTCFCSHILPVWWVDRSLVTSASPLNTLLEQWTLTTLPLCFTVSSFFLPGLHLLPFLTCFPFPPAFWRCFLKGKLKRSVHIVSISRCIGRLRILTAEYISLMYFQSLNYA